MGFKIREINTEGKFCQALTIEALSRAIPSKTPMMALGGMARSLTERDPYVSLKY